MLFLFSCAEPDLEKKRGETASEETAPSDSGDTSGGIDTSGDSDAGDTSEDTDAEGETGDEARVALSCTPPDLAVCDESGCRILAEIETAAVNGTLSLDGTYVPGGWELALAGPTATWQNLIWWVDPSMVSLSHDAAVADLYRVDVSGDTWAGRLPLGEWEAYLIRVDGSGDLEDRLPVGHVTIDGDRTFDVSATRYNVEVWLGVGGVALESTSKWRTWRILLHEETTGALHVLDHHDPLTIELPAGEWTATMLVESSSLGLAAGTWDLGTFTIAGDGVVVLDIDAVDVGGALSWDGAPTFELDPGSGDSRPWQVKLRDVGGDGDFDLYVVTGEGWSTRVPPGTYDLELRGPVTGYGPQGVDMTGPTSEDIDVITYSMSGSATVLGVPIASLGAWSVGLIDERNTITATTVESTWQATVPEGVWDVWVMYYGGPFVRVATDIVVAADGTLDVDVVDHAVSGTLTFDGGPPSRRYLTGDWGLTFVDTETGVSRNTVGVGESDGRWQTRLGAGTYNVSIWLRGEDPL